jgi:uncharacterized protein with von Willebrand factor type A (vWA) domain
MMPTTDAHDTVVGDAILARLTAFSTALRRAGIPTTQAGTIDAVHALGEVDLGDRRQVREALAAVTLTSGAQRPTFDALFDLFLPPRVGTGEWDPSVDLDGTGDSDAGEGASDGALDGPADEGLDAEAFVERLLRRLLEGDEEEVRRLAREAVDRFGRLPGTAGGAPGGRGWFRYRVLRAVDPTSILEQMLQRGVDDPDALTPLQLRLARDEMEARVRLLVQEIDAEVRRRAAADRDPQAIARSTVPAALEELDLLHLSGEQQAELRRRIRPLARRLATRAAVRRRRGHDGRLDVRRTVRRALSTGGVPFDPSFRPRRPHRPELFLLCDVSGSVATFARFTLMLVHAMQEEFSGVRSFAFVDALDEVSHLFDSDDVETAVARLMTEARIVWSDGHSDYGRALETFVERHGHEVTARSTVVVLGDARTNYRHPGAQALERIQRRARRVWWLNPEPRSAWDTGDSVAASYARYVEEMVEVRNLRQLAAFVERVA